MYLKPPFLSSFTLLNRVNSPNLRLTGIVYVALALGAASSLYLIANRDRKAASNLPRFQHMRGNFLHHSNRKGEI